MSWPGRSALLPRPFRSLHAKLLWGTVLVIFVVMAAVIVVVEDRQRAATVDEFQRRGEGLARGLAATSRQPLLLYNFTALEQNVVRVGTEPDVLYAIVLDADRRVAAHSRHPEQVGLRLSGTAAERAAASDEPVTQEAEPVDGSTAYDFGVPILVEGRKWGTARVGLSKRRMEAEIWWTRAELAGLTGAALLLAGCAAAVVARRIAGPVRELARHAAAISRGELDQRIVPATADEIGDLAVAFNDMTGQLRQQRTALEDAHGELRRRFEELVDLKGYTDTILASLTTGVMTVDVGGRVVTLNPAAELITGVFAGEAAGRYCTELFALSPGLAELLMDTLASGQPTGGVQLALRRRDGTTVAVEFSVAPLRGGEGKDLGVVGVLRDLTLVRELERQLRRSDQLAALGTMAAGLAHEIKNPLTSLLTFTRHLLRRFDDQQFREKFAQVVPHELERINAIVERLLELARPAPLRAGPVRLAGLLDRIVDLCASHVDAKQIRVVREYAAGLPAVQGDEDSLYRALVNLVVNALEATGPGGRLTLRLGWDDRLRMPWRTSGRRIAVEIEDTGVGIPPADVDRVFTPFFTTKEQGTGLGLALTHKIVEDHGGGITFVSTPGRGTTFRVVLPVGGPAVGGEVRA